MNNLKYILFYTFIIVISAASCSKEKIYPVKDVVLTFDDAPGFPENTSLILDILQKHQVKATFFCVGELLRAYPALAGRISSEQFMANHTYTHIKLAQYDISGIFDYEIRQTQDIIDSLQPGNGHYFRPPYSKITTGQKAFLAREGYEIIMWDLSADEWRDDVSSQDIIDYFHRNLFLKSRIPVILFHLNLSTTGALDPILLEFEEEGINVISLEELRKRD